MAGVVASPVEQFWVLNQQASEEAVVTVIARDTGEPANIEMMLELGQSYVEK